MWIQVLGKYSRSKREKLAETKGLRSPYKSDILWGGHIKSSRMISFDSRSHIQDMLMQKVDSHDLGQLRLCGFAGYSVSPGCFHGLTVECLQLFQLNEVSCRWIYHSGVWRTVTFFSQHY